MAPPVHLITGDDDYLLQRALEDFLAERRADTPELDVDIVDAADAAGLPEMRTGTLFGGERCVVLRGADALTGNLDDEVEAYLEDPVESVLFVLVGRSGRKPTGRLAQAAEIGTREDVRLPPPWKDAAWEGLARDEFERHGRTASRAALRAILEHAGNDAAAIASKCGQVVAATEAGTRIDVEDVEKVVEGHGARGAFAIADAVTERDPEQAIVATRGALEAGDEPLAILGAITFRFRQLLQVRAGASAKEVDISPGQHGRLTGIARRQYGPGELAWCQDRLARADIDLKSSDLDPNLVFELAVIDLATRTAVGPPWNPLA